MNEPGAYPVYCYDPIKIVRCNLERHWSWVYSGRFSNDEVKRLRLRDLCDVQVLPHPSQFYTKS